MNQKNKSASFIAPNMGVGETLLSSLAMGGGSFATMRLLKELMDMSKPQHAYGENDSTLTIDLPKNMMPGYMQEQPAPGMQPKQAGDDINKTMAILGGLPAGFLGTKFLYDKYKQHQLQQELNLANNQYMQAMQQFRQPDEPEMEEMGGMPGQGMEMPKFSSENTPAVDAFCEKLAEEMNKSAGVLDSIGNVMTGVGNTAASMFKTVPEHEALKQKSNEIMREQGTSNLINTLLPGGLSDVAKEALLLGGLGLGGLTFGGMAYANKSREEAEKKRQFPSSVEINYA